MMRGNYEYKRTTDHGRQTTDAAFKPQVTFNSLDDTYDERLPSPSGGLWEGPIFNRLCTNY